MIALLALALTARAGVLDGHYALSLHTVTRTRVPFLGWVLSETVSDGLVEIFDRGGIPTQRQEVCSVRITSRGPAARVEIPPRFVASLPIKEVALALYTDASGTTGYRADLGVDSVGFDAASPTPRKPDDPGVLDTDHDGHPGATVWIDVPVLGKAELYVVQRASMVLVGTLVEEGGVTGRVELGPVEQHTIAASNRLLVASPRIEPVPGESWFRLSPVAPDARCESIVGIAPQQ